MCGIAGYAGPAPPDDAAVARTLALMARRGPDSRRAERLVDGDRQTVLLHARLSIIDLDPRSDQPFRVGDKRMVYNGELYNYREVRDGLARRGARFRTASDTEVLLSALDDGGWDALDGCEGMWAFAVHDAADGSLTLVRDRFGEKPLYLWRDGIGGLFFASEVKFIASLAGRRLPVDEDHVLRYLVNGYKALHKQPRGFFRGVEEVPAGTVLRIDRSGRERSWRYWRPDLAPPPLEEDFDTIVAGVRERLVRAVELRLRADVPVAFCLSGGVDSNALAGIARKVLDHEVHAFTIVNSDSRYEESATVEASVRHLGIRHTTIPVNGRGFLPGLRELVRQHDAPVYTINYYLHWLLQAEIAKAGYRIAISGTAADEIFSGYFDHHLLYLHDVRGDAALHAASTANWRTHIAPLVRNPFLQDPDVFVRDPRFRGHVYLDAETFSGYLHRPWREPFVEAFYTPDLLRNRMLNEIFHEATPVILHEDDLNAMYHSVENRSPFLDRALFEHAQRIPTRHLVRDGAAKAVLREAIRGIAADVVVDERRKVGFNAPIEDLLGDDLAAVRAEILADGPIYDLVRRDAIEDLLARTGLTNSFSKFLFSFVSAKMFLEEFA